MTEENERLYRQRLGRYQAVMALEPVDRVPVALVTNYFALAQSGYNYQDISYDPEIRMRVKLEFSRKYPEVDTFRITTLWAPLLDAVDYDLFRIPGRDIAVNSLQQFVEAEYMKEDEYRLLIDDPVGFRMDRYLPRVLGEFGDRGSIRSYMAFLKSGIALGMSADIARDRSARLAAEAGLPLPTAGSFFPPLDYLSDNLRGLNGITRDFFRQPENVCEACEALLPDLVNAALASADQQRQLPLFIATHKPCFMSPQQFDRFYWPTFKKGVLALIEAGHTCRLFLEGNWSAHWHHIRELPRGKVLCDLDNESDVFAAKAAFGDQQCIAGGIPDDLLILGAPDQVRARVKLLCETVGLEGGWIARSGTNAPQDTKPENFRAMLDALTEYGRYSDGPAPEPRSPRQSPSVVVGGGDERMVTPWAVKRTEWEIPGDEELIKTPWEKLEKMAYNWLISW